MRPPVLLFVLAAALLGSCGDPTATPDDAAAEAAWRRLLDEPGTANYEAFIAANRRAAAWNPDPHDARGIGYQVRAIEAQAAQAVREKDGLLADSVVDRVRELRESGHLDLYEETSPGVRARLEAAEAAAEPLLE